MVRKITLLLLLFIGFNGIVKGQIRDSVFIQLPYGMDTTCPGQQLTFTATESNDTFSNVQYHWYTDTTFTNVIIDTFHTTALVDSDSVYCYIVFTNSLGALDSFRSNTIIVHRSSSFPPRILISLTVGSNPDCQGHELTFTAYPVNGGTSPAFQWMVGDTVLAGEDSITITRYFNANDTVRCQLISNSTCSSPYSDTDTSNAIVVSHDSLNAMVSIVVDHNPICAGEKDTLVATVVNTGTGATLAWYVDSTLVPTALGPDYYTDSLHNGSLVYAILNAPDPCVINHSTVSNIISMTVIPLLPDSVSYVVTHGSNPGCIDSPMTFTGTYVNFGTSPSYDWYVNGVLAAHDTTVFTSTFLDNQVVTFKVHENDNGCYMQDTIVTAPFLMIRDSTPVTPWLSLVGDLLVVNNGGSYKWYIDSVHAFNGTLVAGAVAQTYNPLRQGYYYVIKDSANCPSAPSNIIYIDLLGVKNITAANARVYPNPGSGIINIDWGSTIVGEMKMDVYNMLGQGLHHEDIVGESHHVSDLSYLPEGSYIMVLRDEEGNKATYKISIIK